MNEKKFKTAPEIERKYLIRYPEREAIAAMPAYTESTIEQIYLNAAPGTTRRVRRREKNGKVTCTETVKRRVSAATAEESEREIDESTYRAYAKNSLEGTRPIEKTRLTFVYEGQLFEIDLYPFWQKVAILETELPSETAKVKMPPCLSVLRELTGDYTFSNASLSKSVPAVPEEE